MTKQFTTYYPDYKIKSFMETFNDRVISYTEYNPNGFVIFKTHPINLWESFGRDEYGKYFNSKAGFIILGDRTKFLADLFIIKQKSICKHLCT